MQKRQRRRRRRLSALGTPPPRHRCSPSRRTPPQRPAARWQRAPGDAVQRQAGRRVHVQLTEAHDVCGAVRQAGRGGELLGKGHVHHVAQVQHAARLHRPRRWWVENELRREEVAARRWVEDPGPRQRGADVTPHEPARSRGEAAAAPQVRLGLPVVVPPLRPLAVNPLQPLRREGGRWGRWSAPGAAGAQRCTRLSTAGCQRSRTHAGTSAVTCSRPAHVPRGLCVCAKSAVEADQQAPPAEVMLQPCEKGPACKCLIVCQSVSALTRRAVMIHESLCVVVLSASSSMSLPRLAACCPPRPPRAARGRASGAGSRATARAEKGARAEQRQQLVLVQQASWWPRLQHPRPWPV